jgi:hypothetical protein
VQYAVPGRMEHGRCEHQGECGLAHRGPGDPAA